jgi:nucleotide-binding universal stress UspA family protein
MKPFEKILVPIDFAPHSAEAVRRAVDLSQHYSAALTLVYVYEPLDYALPEGYALYTPEQMGHLMEEFRERLSATQRDVEAMGVSRVDRRVLNGGAAAEIVDHAREHDFDLIVMGTHGRQGLSHLLMGSVAERVLRTAHCPVLTVKAPEEAPASSHGKAA